MLHGIPEMPPYKLRGVAKKMLKDAAAPIPAAEGPVMLAADIPKVSLLCGGWRGLPLKGLVFVACQEALSPGMGYFGGLLCVAFPRRALGAGSCYLASPSCTAVRRGGDAGPQEQREQAGGHTAWQRG